MLTLSRRQRVRDLHQILSPWLIREDMYVSIFGDIFGAVETPTAHLDSGRWRDGSSIMTKNGDTAVISVVGPILKRPGLLSAILGLPTYSEIQDAVRAVSNDPSVKRLVMYIDSPGGVASGCAETAAAIKSLSGKVQTVAFVDGMGTSAAYWLAAACDKVYASPSSEIGSIGAIMLRPEYANPNIFGDRVEVFASGERKKDFVGYVKVSDSVAVSLQKYVDEIGGKFVQSVVQLRGLSEEQAGVISDAGIYTVDEAARLGLIDGIADSMYSVFADSQSDGNGGDVMMSDERNDVKLTMPSEEPVSVSESPPEAEAIVEQKPAVIEQAVELPRVDESGLRVGEHSADVVLELEALRKEIYELKVVAPFMSRVRSLGISDDAELSVFERLVRLDSDVANAVLDVVGRRMSVLQQKIEFPASNGGDVLTIKLPIPGYR